ncbi:PEP-utilizing enzyme [Nanoarchaeota archaeon]
MKEEWKYLWKARPYDIMLMGLASDSVTQGFKKTFGYEITGLAVPFEKGVSSWAIKKKELIEACDVLFNKLKTKDFFENNKKEVIDYCEKLNNLSEKAKRTSLNELSDEELINLFKEFKILFKEFYVNAFVPIILEYGGNILSDKCELFIKKRLEEKEIQDKFGDYFMALLTSPELSGNAKEELGFLRVVKEFTDNPELVELFKSDEETIKNNITNFEQANQAIKQHMNEYEVTSFDLVATIVWDKNYYLNRVAETLKNIDIDKKINEIETKGEVLTKEQERITSELDFSPEEKRMLEITRGYMGLKEYRRWVITESYYRIFKIMEETGKRVGIDKEKIGYLTPDEFEQVFEKKDEFKQIVDKRADKSVAISSEGKTTFYYDFELGEKEEKVSEDISELKGTPACSGNERGVVRVINNLEEAEKMNQGDILVSVATCPELVPTMKRAAAIVTDEGGVTCHAAIVSRELGVPCVIGTKIATKVFKDGDSVEVDAKEGVVRKLK